MWGRVVVLEGRFSVPDALVLSKTTDAMCPHYTALYPLLRSAYPETCADCPRSCPQRLIEDIKKQNTDADDLMEKQDEMITE